MKRQWENLLARLDALSLRERLLIFAGVVMLLASLFDTFLLEPVLLRQKSLRGEVAQQQQVVEGVRAQADALALESAPNSKSPRRLQLEQLRRELAEGNAYLQSSRERLVEPANMAAHLRQILNKNRRLQLMSLKTLPVSPLLEQGEPQPGARKETAKTGNRPVVQEKQVYKHGVQMTMRGSYLDLLNYLTMLESLPQQMYWAKASMTVQQYPVTELTIVVYTLSLDRTWLQI